MPAFLCVCLLAAFLSITSGSITNVDDEKKKFIVEFGI